MRAIIAFLIGLIALTAVPAGAADRDGVLGTWRNLRNTMHIEMYHCGDSICGRVAWANDEAIADARRGGTTKLIGTEIFRNFHQDSGGNWSGQVFVPDMNRTFSGTILVVDRNTLKGSGCLIGHFLCKAKTLVRVA
jgi:uncharacterized protein (DUF2147 family)